jgi:hypothetical protein
MKTLACVLLMSCGSAFAQTSINLSTPNTIALNPVVSAYQCYAGSVTTTAYATVVTGFSADGNYVTGQDSAWFTCGHSGRGSTVHTIYSCAQLTWDLSGNLVSAVAPIAYNNGQPVSSFCPTVPLVYPSKQPPSTSVVGNEFTNSGGYAAETVLVEACGAIACYHTYYYPTLLTP